MTDPKAIMDIDFEKMNEALKRVRDGLDKLPDQRLSDDENPPPVTYPQRAERITRHGDFETAEIERLQAENAQLKEKHDLWTANARSLRDDLVLALDAIERLELQSLAARAAYRTAFAKCPQHVREWLVELGSVLGVE